MPARQKERGANNTPRWVLDSKPFWVLASDVDGVVDPPETKRTGSREFFTLQGYVLEKYG